MVNSFTVNAIVIDRRNIGEADRMVTLFTDREGKLVVRAKGVRKISSKRKGYLELFNTIRAHIHQKDHAAILGEVRLVSDRSFMKKDMKRLRIAYHLTELVERLTGDHQPARDAYELLHRALSSIASHSWNEEDRWTLAFESKLLKLLGFWVPSEDLVDIHEYIEELTDRRLRSREILSSD